MNDGLIANSLHFAAQGAPSMITLWDKTRGQIKGVSAMTTYPLYLITRNPAVTSIKDFAAKDKVPGAHLVTTNYEILGGPATAVLITASSKFRDANPKAYNAFLEALTEAIDTINKDKRAASQVYLQAANDTKNSVDDINTMISDKDYAFTLQPQKVLKTAQFMATTGSIKRSPTAISDLFFDDLRGLKGD